MQVYRKSKPGSKGTKVLLRDHGEKLVCVRYREDRVAKKRYKTIELIVDEWDWEKEQPDHQKKAAGEQMFWFRFCEYLPVLFDKVRMAGGERGKLWGVWGLPWSKAKELELLKNPLIQHVKE